MLTESESASGSAGVRRLKSMKISGKIAARVVVGMSLTLMTNFVAAETCTTQSQMSATDRSALSATAGTLAAKMQAGDAAGLRALSVAEVAKDFAAISDVVGGTAPKLKGATLVVDQVYLLDASTLKPAERRRMRSSTAR